MSKRYNHAFTLAFSVDTDEREYERIPVWQITEALLRRIADVLEHDEMWEAIGPPWDSVEFHKQWCGQIGEFDKERASE